jgi:hypothetical protein
MVTVRYRPLRDQIATCEVLLRDRIDWIVGTITNRDGQWLARRRGDEANRMVAHPSRTDAAKWLLTAGDFARERAI